MEEKGGRVNPLQQGPLPSGENPEETALHHSAVKRRPFWWLCIAGPFSCRGSPASTGEGMGSMKPLQRASILREGTQA